MTTKKKYTRLASSAVAGLFLLSQFAAPVTVGASHNNDNDGSITIIKDAQPNSSQDFDFEINKRNDGQSGDNFSLRDDGNDSNNSEKSEKFDNLSSGTYDVTEFDETGWLLSSIICSQGANATTDLANGKVSIVLAQNQNVTCTFVNKKASIQIIKDAQPNDAEDFAFTATGSGLSSFNLDDDSDATLSNSKLFTGLSAGSYSVTEGAETSWVLSSIDCGNAAVVKNGSTVTITLAIGQDVVCTFTNQKNGTLKVYKHTNPDGDQTQFSITATGSGTIGGNATRTIADGESEEFAVTQGTYSVSEVVPSGWTQTANTCQEIVINAENLNPTCDITNTKNPEQVRYATLTIKKQAEPKSAQDFSFTSEKLGNFVLDDDSDATLTNSKQFTELTAGEYIVNETTLAGWNLAHIGCQGTESYTVVLNDGKLVVNLIAGDNVTCTFVNEVVVQPPVTPPVTPPAEPQKGSISGLKFEDQNKNGLWDTGEPGLSGWAITATPCVSANTCTGTAVTKVTDQTGAFKFNDVTPGLYRVCETLQANWVQTYPEGGVCWTVTVSGGKDCVVDFGNFKNGQVMGSKFNDVNGNGLWDAGELGLKGWTISVYKVSDLAGILGQALATATTGDTGNYSFTNLPMGTYKVCETQKATWTRTFPSGSDCHEFTITKSSQVITANFGNKAKPQVLAATLVNTGTDASKNMLVGLTILSILGAVHFLTSRRKDYAK